MPHLIIEYSSNLATPEEFAVITRAGHETMIESGLFSAPDIKTRSYRTEDFLVGEKGGQGSFIHATVYLMQGRTLAQKQTLSESLRNSIKALANNVDQLSVDIRELDKETYRKHVS